MYEREKDKVSQQQDFMRVGTCGYHGDGFVTELFPFSFNSIFVPLGDCVSVRTRGWQCRTSGIVPLSCNISCLHAV